MGVFEKRLAIFSAVVASLGLVFHFYPSPLTERPSLIVKQNFGLIEIENQGKGVAKIIEIKFSKDNKNYCFNEKSFAKLNKKIVFFNVNKSALSKNVEIGSGNKLELVSCKFCKESDYSPFLEEIKVNIKYKGVGLLESEKSVCFEKEECNDSFFKNGIYC